MPCRGGSSAVPAAGELTVGLIEWINVGSEEGGEIFWVGHDSFRFGGVGFGLVALVGLLNEATETNGVSEYDNKGGLLGLINVGSKDGGRDLLGRPRRLWLWQWLLRHYWSFWPSQLGREYQRRQWM